eukprot:GGOE01058625.1.p1 GENE.GGOE01058625.1~~GGOE01058625.1.p1  ORF type:complete len:642 (+),score=136.23 GGOE01058625.1:22-1926(+)
MPGVSLWGYSFAFGGDDVVIPAGMHALTRIALVVQATLAVFGMHQGTCADRTTRMFAFIFELQLGFAIVGFFLFAATTWLGSRGTILDDSPRKGMSCLLGWSVVFLLCEVALVTFATLCTFVNLHTLRQNRAVCQVHSYYLHVLFWWLMFAWGSYLLECIVLYFCLCTGESSNETWHRRLQWVFGGSRADVLEEIAWMLDRYTVGFNLVPSDIMVGLHLLRQQDAERGVNDVDAQCPLPPEVALDEVQYYAKYYVAIYGGLLFFYMHPARWLFGLFCQALCLRRPPLLAHGDCLGLNARALLQVTGLAPEDVLYASFLNALHRPVYYIALDREKKAIVVAIRGTLSLADTVTDLDAALVTHPVDGVGDVEVHRGMMAAAQTVLGDLKQNGILEQAFRLHPDYCLLVTGHSLGAGTATLLSLLLFPHMARPLKCIAYAPPGGLMSENGAEYSRRFVTSVVFGDDVIPRLGIHPLLDLRGRLLRALACCRRQKWSVICGCCGSSAEDWDEEDEEAKQILRRLWQAREAAQAASQSEHLAATQDCSLPGNGVVRRRGGTLSDATQLWPPGDILYLKPQGDEYQVKWADRKTFQRIVLSPRMFSDHLPDVMARALAEARRPFQDIIEADDRTPLLSAV